MRLSFKKYTKTAPQLSQLEVGLTTATLDIDIVYIVLSQVAEVRSHLHSIGELIALLQALMPSSRPLPLPLSKSLDVQ